MDISALYNISSGVIREAAETSAVSGRKTDTHKDMFASVLNAAMDTLNETNAYISNAENEKIKLALGQTDNTHDLTIAMQKSSEAIQYTVAVRDKFLEAYKEIMNMQI